MTNTTPPENQDVAILETATKEAVGRFGAGRFAQSLADDSNDFPLGKACDRNDPECEACQ